MTARRIVLATTGSLGDLHPYLALARELKARGHEVRIVTHSIYRERVEGEGVAFFPTRPEMDPGDPTILRRAMDKKGGPEYVIRTIALGHLRDAFEDVHAAASGADFLVTHPVFFAAQLAARVANRPWASVVLSPLSLYSVHDPPVYPGLPFEYELAGLGPGWQRFLLQLADTKLKTWLAPYRALEADLGLPAAPNPILHGQHSPYLVLALFSPIFGPPQPDWPAHCIATGFPFLEAGTSEQGGTRGGAASLDPTLGALRGGGAASLDPALRTFLDGGEAPIVFTLGSAAVGNAGDFYEHSVEAAERAGRRALLLVGRDPANRPRRALSSRHLAVEYAPHSAVFPRAEVIVHQGGIGTTGEALRAGRPMLVVPHAHDQPDHARRLTRMGLARRIPAERYTARRAARALAELLSDSGAAAKAREVGDHVRAERGVATACDAIERTMAGETPTG